MSPELDLTISGEAHTCNNRNTRLQTYFGEIALYDNILITPGEQTEDAESIIIFKENATYEQLKAILLEMGFPAYLNQPEAQEGIVTAYLSQFNSDLGDFVPEDWQA